MVKIGIVFDCVGLGLSKTAKLCEKGYFTARAADIIKSFIKPLDKNN